MTSNTRIQPEPRSTPATARKLSGDEARTDPEIARGVRQALAGNPLTPGEHIHFTVSQGWITLTGEVERRRRREDAVRLVEQVTGVGGVSDLILIAAHTPPIEPHTVHQAIQEALHRRAGREAGRISVRVEQGTLTLAGDVHSWTERRAILGAAGQVPGVREVSDHLRFRPYG
ncbi:MAG TPA: BON domain-containing protein [Chloroflexota bacterium]|nr:BON domain-containing protein [Chloroflexota bacterium]